MDGLNRHKITTVVKPQYGHLFDHVKRILKKTHIANQTKKKSFNFSS